MELMIVVLIAVVVFIATNLDDIFILMSFFAMSDSRIKVIFGQYLGFLLLLAISLACYMFKYVLPLNYLAFLGLFPIIIGIKYLWNFRKDIFTDGMLEKSFGPVRTQKETPLKGYGDILHVAIATIANGGDNLAVYIPLFMTMGNIELGITTLTFMGMVGLWCVLAYTMVNNRIFGDKLKVYGHLIFPLILILIGFGIIFRNP
ncbi:MAG: cadmium resistance protein [Methanobacterium sp.]|nr:cadmium resistance protein [Methanobacterium sp.]